MNVARIRETILGYPVAAASLAVTLLAAGLLWYDGDEGVELSAKRDSLKAEVASLGDNRRNARNLPQDIARAKSLHEKIAARAIDFDSTIATSAFASRLAQNGSVKVEGLPTQRGAPLAAATKPFATAEFSLSARGDFPSLLAFVGEIADDEARSMVVTRTQFMADGDTAKTGLMRADIGFRLWGYVKPGPGPVVAATPDKTVSAAGERGRRLASFESLLVNGRADLTGAVNPFGGSMSSAGPAAPGAAELDAVLARLAFTIGTIDGNPVVKIEGYGMLPKRLNAEIELPAGGRINRMRITEIGDDSFTVVTSAGKKIKVSPHK